MYYRELDLEDDLGGGGAPYVVSIGPIFHNTTEPCLKRIGYVGYEKLKIEMCRLAEDMN